MSTPAVFAALCLTRSANAQSQWNLPGSGDWATAGNWLPNGVPNGTGVSALLGTSITSNSVITFNASETVGTLTFDSPFQYAISGSGTFT